MARLGNRRDSVGEGSDGDRGERVEAIPGLRLAGVRVETEDLRVHATGDPGEALDSW